jgi:hypothetical protein
MGAKRIRCQRDFAGVVEIPVTLGSDEREMRLGEADREEERLGALAAFFEDANGRVGNAGVAKGVIGDFGGFEGGALAVGPAVCVCDWRVLRWLSGVRRAAPTRASGGRNRSGLSGRARRGRWAFRLRVAVRGSVGGGSL